jgi:hypothetical protein
MKNVPTLELDHLVVAARTLDEGARFVADALGVEPVAGGAHPAMGTHNRLVGLWGGAYLEVISIDPQAPTQAPGASASTSALASTDSAAAAAAGRRARLFALDDPGMQARLERGPCLVHWVARVLRPKDLARWQAQYPARIAPVIPMTRGDLSWRLTVPEDGAFPGQPGAGDGIVPTLIQWDTPAHPSARLPATGLALRSLKARHPRAEAVREQLDWLGAAHLIELEDAAGGEPALAAEIETPAGLRTLGRLE